MTDLKPTDDYQRQLQFELAQDTINGYIGRLSGSLYATEKAIPKPIDQIADLERDISEAHRARYSLNELADDASAIAALIAKYKLLTTIVDGPIVAKDPVHAQLLAPQLPQSGT